MLDPDEHNHPEDHPEDRCLDDAWITYDDLDNRFADTRWPNPRTLLQNRVSLRALRMDGRMSAASESAPRCYEWPRKCPHHDDLD